MTENQEVFSNYVPILIQAIVAGGFVVLVLLVTHLLGPKVKSKHKLENFESGIEQQGNARLPFSIKYFLTAILFVLFDVEVIFMYPWAINFKDFIKEQGGIQGFYSMLIFLGFFLLGFFYVVKKGALKWE